MKELLGSDVSVSVPARAGLVRVFRSVVGGVAARLDLSYDQIDDLQIAVGEACATLLEAAAPQGMLSLTIHPDQDGLSLTAAVDAGPDGWPSNLQDSLAGRVLSALMDEAAFEAEDTRLVIRMRKARTDGG